MDNLKELTFSELQPHIGSIILYLIGVIIWIGGASLASSNYEHKGHKPHLYFFLGLAIPVAFPALSFFLAKPYTATNNTNDHTEEQESSADDELEDSYIDLGKLADINANYFSSFASDHLGHRPGPFRIDTLSGEMIVDKITQVNDEFITVEIANKQSGEIQKLRLPYSNITDCKQI